MQKITKTKVIKPSLLQNIKHKIHMWKRERPEKLTKEQKAIKDAVGTHSFYLNQWKGNVILKLQDKTLSKERREWLELDLKYAKKYIEDNSVLYNWYVCNVQMGENVAVRPNKKNVRKTFYPKKIFSKKVVFKHDGKKYVVKAVWKRGVLWFKAVNFKPIKHYWPDGRLGLAHPNELPNWSVPNYVWGLSDYIRCHHLIAIGVTKEWDAKEYKPEEEK